MATEEQLAILRQGAEVWNKWRDENVNIDLHFDPSDFSGLDLRNVNLTGATLLAPHLSGFDLRNVNLSRAHLIQADLSGTNLTGAKLLGTNLFGANLSQAILTDVEIKDSELLAADFTQADLRKVNFYNQDLFGAIMAEANLEEAIIRRARGVNFHAANLRAANLSTADLLHSDLSNADLQGATLQGATLYGTNLSGANLRDASFMAASLVQTNLEGADLTNSYIYGVSAWDIKVDKRTKQQDLIITRDQEPIITVDNIKVAQFIYLILGNEEIRDVINTLTSKSVLILGRFAIRKRKAVLDALRNKLREYDLLPIVFDFDRPTDKDYTETVKTLAALSLFVILDVTQPKSTPMEMEALVSQFKISYVPIIDISVDKRPFAMIVDSQKSFHWVLETFGYKSKKELLENIEEAIIKRALKKHNELRDQKANEPKLLTIKDLKQSKTKKQKSKTSK
jgi:uncharacterized protein YjbI with pentapeptide repeats